jgi:hypothetical protein
MHIFTIYGCKSHKWRKIGHEKDVKKAGKSIKEPLKHRSPALIH